MTTWAHAAAAGMAEPHPPLALAWIRAATRPRGGAKYLGRVHTDSRAIACVTEDVPGTEVH